MATLNVRDFGAVGDGSTDDTGAIQDAVDNASAGDTVYIPSGQYHVVAPGNGPAVRLDNIADAVTIEGDGQDSVLLVTRSGSSGIAGCMGMETSPSWDSITVRNLVFDGNSQNVEFSMGFQWWASATGKDILMEDCVFQNATRHGCAAAVDGLSNMTFRNCTARDNGDHGFNTFGTGEGSPSNPEIKFISTKSVNNGGIGINLDAGNNLVDGFYADGLGSGMKVGIDGGPLNHVTLRNFHHRNSGNKGFYQTITEPHEWSLELDNVQMVGHYKDGIELRRTGSVTVTGPVLIDRCAEQSDEANFAILENCSVNTEGGRIITQNAHSNAGLYNNSPRSSTVDTLQHWNNPNGPVGNGSGTLTVNQFIEEEHPGLDVPGPDDVGAFSGGAGDGGDNGGGTDGVDVISISAPSDPFTLVEYEIVVDGSVTPGPEADMDVNDSIDTRADGTAVITGLTGNGGVDDWEVDGEILSFTANVTADSQGEDFTVRKNGSVVSIDDIVSGVGGASGSSVARGVAVGILLSVGAKWAKSRFGGGN